MTHPKTWLFETPVHEITWLHPRGRSGPAAASGPLRAQKILWRLWPRGSTSAAEPDRLSMPPSLGKCFYQTSYPFLCQHWQSIAQVSLDFSALSHCSRDVPFPIGTPNAWLPSRTVCWLSFESSSARSKAMRSVSSLNTFAWLNGSIFEDLHLSLIMSQHKV